MDSQFSVPKPCHENWGDMTPNEQGRFCSQCAKTVTDFTQMSTAEITIYLRQNSGNRVCGRFRSDQLEEKVSINIPRKALYSQTKFINVFLLALLVSMGSMLFSCKDNSPEIVGELAVEPVDSVALPPPTPDRSTTVGIVVSPNDTVSIASPPPSIPVKEAPKVLMREVATDSVKQKP